MTEQELQRQKDHEEDLQRLRGFRMIDDTFLRVFLRGELGLAQYILRTITGIKDLKLTKESTPQKDLKRLAGARGLCLDYHGVDTEKRQYDLEVQRANDGANPKRVRYHASALDVENLDEGDDFENLPTTYIIMLTEHDYWKKGKALYPVEKNIEGEKYDDGQHTLYVNASYKGKEPIGKLMHDFKCSNPDDMYSKRLAERAKYLKRDPEGVEIMCQAMEEMRDEVEVRTRVQAIKNIMETLKLTAQQAMEALKIPADDQPKYLAKI